MANKIILKRASTQGRVPVVADLDLGELAINTFDGRLFAKKNDGSAAIIDLKQNDPIRVLGDASGSYAWDQSTYTSNVTVTLNTVNSTTGSFGGKTGGTLTIPIVTVNEKGLVTSVTTTTYSAAGDLGTLASQDANSVSITGGTIDGTAIGQITRAAGNFTDVDTSGNVTISGKLYSNDITASNVTVDGDTVITGNLTVQGMTTTVNSTTVSVGDLNIELAKDATTAAQANGAGITVVGPGVPATLTYTSSNDSWNLNKNLNGTTLNLTGGGEASYFYGEIRPTSSGDSAGGIVFPANPGGGTNDLATIRYYAATGEQTVLELKVTNDDAGGSADVIRLNAAGGTQVDNRLTAGNVAVTSLTAGRMLFVGTDGLLVDDADLTYNSTTNTVTVPNLSVGTNVAISNSLSVTSLTTTDTLNVATQATVSNLTVTGTTNLNAIAVTGVSAGQLVYGSATGALKSESDLTYNESTNTLTVGNLTTVTAANIGSTLDVTGVTTLKSTVDLTDAATFTLANYATGAFKIAGDASFAKSIQVQTDIHAAGTIKKAGFDVLNTQDTIDGGSY